MKIAIVVGVSRGLGEALCKEFLVRGHYTIGLGRNNIGAFKNESPKNYEFLPLDLSHPLEASRIAEKCFNELKTRNPDQIDFVHSAATVDPVGLIDRVDAALTLEGLHTNLVAPVLLSQAFLKSFRTTQARKRIILVSSGAAVVSVPGSNIYCVAKAGLEMFTRGVASENEHSKNEIPCIAFRPGVIDGYMQDRMRTYSVAEVPAVTIYKEYYEKKMLLAPHVIARACYKNLIEPEIVTSGHTYSMKDFQ